MSSANPQENPTENLRDQSDITDSDARVTSTSAMEPAVQESVDSGPSCVREVAVEIPAEVVNKEFDLVVQRYTKVARIPGFRKGKVPASIVRSRFTEEIRSDVLEALVPRYFREAVLRDGFNPISEPHIHDLENQPGQAVRFKAAFEIMPDFQLGNYQEMKLDVAEVKVTDEDVQAELKSLQERQASFDPVHEDRPLRDGDFAQISFQAVSKETVPTPPAEGQSESPAPTESDAKAAANQPVKMDEILVEIGGENTLVEFSSNLRGAKPGEERAFDVTYPSDYHDTRLAGKTLSYTAKINALKTKTTPELTDDFAKELSQDFRTFDDLRKHLRESITAERQYQSLNDARERLLSQLAEDHVFAVPETLVQKQIDLRLEQWLRGLAAQGMRTEDMKRLDFKRLRASQHEAAAREVRAHMVLEKIADAENIQASDEEVNRQVQALAQQAKETPEAMQRRLADSGGIERIRKRIRGDKALRFLYDKSTGNARNGAVQE